MILDYLDPSTPDDFDCHVCVIGAGPAGIAIANAFAHSRFTVCVLESGGLDSEEASQALNGGDSVGTAMLDPALCRLRALGGSCRLWGGGCVPLTRLDLASRPWVPSSGWPIDFDELAAWCRQARETCGIDPRHDIADGSFANARFIHALPLRGDDAVDRVCIESPVLFQAHYTQLLQDAGNITLLLHANLMELAAAPDADRVQAARIGALDGRRGTVRARHYVLAAGGIENARLLLASDSVHPRGLGNGHDQVGRHFMDHPRCLAGQVVGGDLASLLRPYDRDGQRESRPLYRELALADGAQRRLGLLNARARPIPVADATPAGLQALRELRATFRAPAVESANEVEGGVQRALAAGIGGPAPALRRGAGRRARLALRVGMNAGDVAGAVARRLRNRPVDRYRRVDLMTYFEQAPNPDSRITLSEARDALGMRKVRVDWRLTELDYASYRTSAALLGEEAARCCGGRFEAERWVGDAAIRPDVVGTAHHIGTTRMSGRPEDGVVDRDCRVHGMENLHVAGSSVFPTGGWAFPTFTIVALAVRLADRLRTGLEIVGL
ncbi:GMC family oxidoreductase [Luteimonas padinae]|uniref:GMC oxidoreductase n=1 Tax=Luteimonas padinae TaxID=1714359 RepID=A0ABV6SZ36_9GAMM|nr:GMC family oxidoreductase [Luteimonas padinae]